MPIPIPKKPSGYRRGSPSALVQVEAFIDLECPFSKRAWPTLLRLTEAFSPGDVSLLVHPITLPGHRQSFDVTVAAHVVADGQDESFFDFATHLFGHQRLYKGDAWREKSLVDLSIMLADLAHSHCQVDRGGFLRSGRSEEILQATKTPMRYAAMRGIWSTPTFFINSAEVPALLPKSSLEDWRMFLGPLLR